MLRGFAAWVGENEWGTAQVGLGPRRAEEVRAELLQSLDRGRLILARLHSDPGRLPLEQGLLLATALGGTPIGGWQARARPVE